MVPFLTLETDKNPVASFEVNSRNQRRYRVPLGDREDTNFMDPVSQLFPSGTANHQPHIIPVKSDICMLAFHYGHVIESPDRLITAMERTLIVRDKYKMLVLY